MKSCWKVGILLFHEVEVLDFAGPFEVFSVTEAGGSKAFDVKTVGQSGAVLRARNGLQVLPSCTFDTVPPLDILIVPGGYGAEEVELHNEALLGWIRKCAETAEIVASVCTGAFLLAQCGLLDGKRAVTHWMDMPRLKREYPQVRVTEGERFIDEGSIVTSGGISAGIDMSLYLVQRLLGEETARQTAKRMDYRWTEG